MTTEQLPDYLTDRCDIYFEGSLISKERIIKNYADFFAASFSGESRTVSIGLHTGSVCFDVISLITAALGCLYIDDSDSNYILEQLRVGDLVMYGEKKPERYIWRGFADQGCKCVAANTEKTDRRYYAVLEQPTRAIKTYAPRTMWHLITPYNGDSQMTDGRGLKKNDTNRIDFISYLFGISPAEIPSVTGVSVVILAERRTFDRISKGLRIEYSEGKSIGLLDLVTASYYSDSGEEYRYPGNAAQNDPMLKIARKVSTARKLVLDRRGNKSIGLLVSDSAGMVKGSSELTDLLGRKSLRFIHLASNIDSDNLEHIIETQEDAEVFACTKEYLLQNAMPSQEKNDLTVELHRQIENIVKNTVSTVTVEGGCSWKDFRTVKEALYAIRNSDWNDYLKDRFIIIANSLLNLFTTAVFSMEVLEKATEDGKLFSAVSSPSAKINELWELADSAGPLDERCMYVADVLERLYNASFSECPKHNVLTQYLNTAGTRRIAVVVPKAYYIDVLNTDLLLAGKNVCFVNANRFEKSEQYDEMIVVGDFIGKRFDPLKCRSSSEITVLLYDCETHWFKQKKKKASGFEHKLNSKLGIIGKDIPDNEQVLPSDHDECEDINRFVADAADLDRYIDEISTFDLGKFVAKVSNPAGNALTAEICAVGRFVSGEQILFSKYYDAVVFDPAKGTVIETDAENLSAGDMLVFAKRDDNTRNMVDFIYENLLASGRFNTDILEATEKASYWKEALREYKKSHGLSYRDIAQELQRLGSSLQEVAIRQWLIEESHVVGPKEEKTIKQIAELTQDSHLLDDTHGYFEACRIVRRKRKEILVLIGKAIKDKLSGHVPPKGSVFEVVYENVENLSKTLELEGISTLDEPVIVPINIINKPISEWEVEI